MNYLYVKGNDTEQQEIALKFENKIWTYEGTAEERKGSEKELELVNSFDKNEYIDTKNVAERLSINHNYAKQLIKKCYDKNLIHKEGRGKYTILDN